MSSNLKKRIITSFVLLIFLLLSFINYFLLGYFLLIITLLSLVEFFAITANIFAKNKNKIFLTNIIFIIFIFNIGGILFILSSYFHLKILIFLLLLTCVVSDIGGFISGNIFKGPKLTKISPNKTISGAVGSLVFSTIFVTLIIGYMTNNFEPNSIIVGLITSIGCQSGDLFFSFLKRKSNLKHTGNILPGHGGILDRIDGMLLGIPLGFLTLLIVY